MNIQGRGCVLDPVEGRRGVLIHTQISPYVVDNNEIPTTCDYVQNGSTIAQYVREVKSNMLQEVKRIDL
jgi:hypothetical protein